MKLFFALFLQILANEYAATEEPAVELTPDDIKVDQDRWKFNREKKIKIKT